MQPQQPVLQTDDLNKLYTDLQRSDPDVALAAYREAQRLKFVRTLIVTGVVSFLIVFAVLMTMIGFVFLTP